MATEKTQAYDALGKGRTTFTPHKGRVFEDMADLQRATLIQLVSTGTVSRDDGKVIATGLAKALDSYDDPTDPMSWDYLALEAKLLENCGPVGSMIHTGRSRQDITSTLCEMEARNSARVSANAMLTVRESLLTVAEKHILTVIPAYTHGVPAQPTTFAHYLLSFHDSMERHYHRMEDAYSRANLGALGSDVMTSSRFRHDRPLASKLLGFDGPVKNSFDAVHGHPNDALCEVTQNMSLVSVLLSRYMMDMNVWQMTAHPWIYMSPSKLMSVSSSMPQKRNPRAMEWVRSMGAIVSASSEMFLMSARNHPTGMSDVRDNMARMPDEIMVQMLNFTSDIILSIAINVNRARDETAKDYSTMIDIPEALYIKAKVPFRIGHRLASLLTDYGRENGIYPYQIPYAEAQSIYKRISEHGQDLELDEKEFKATLDPVEYVKSRAGIGGPQEKEMQSMIAETKTRLAADKKLAGDRNKQLSDARERCKVEFENLMK